MLDNLELVRRVTDQGVIAMQTAVRDAIYQSWRASGLEYEDYFRTHILEYKQPEMQEGYGTQFQLDFEAVTFTMKQEFRIRKKTAEELELDNSQVLPGL